MRLEIYLGFIVVILISITDCEAQDDLLPRTFNFGSSSGQTCEARGLKGVCRRRTRCKRPTNKICSIGIIPVVCCIDESRPSSTRSPVTKPPPAPVTKPQPIVFPTSEPGNPDGKNDDGSYVDIIYPGCGKRYPVSSASNKPSSTSSRGFGGLGGLFSRTVGLGRRKRAIKPVIVGGVTAKPNSWPWMVAVFRKTSSRQRFLCGASLISQKYVLTAAHCFPSNRNLDPSKYVVLTGAHNTTQQDGRWHQVQDIVIHPSYSSGQYYNDMSILKLAEPVRLDSKVHPVCLPSPSLRSRVGNTKKNVTVTGWGDTSFGGRASKVLQEVELPIVPVKECNSSYATIARTPFPKGINNLFICAGLKEGGKDACQGDSGGPMVMQMNDGNYLQLGIVSFGYGCASPGFPGVYTRISKFTKWISANTDLGQT